MDAAALYREEMFTDRKVGAIRQLTPVTADGAPDTTRPVLFLGQAEIMTNMGPVPLSFEIEGKTLAEAVAGFSAAATVAIERTVQQIQEMRRQAASQLVVPQGGMPNLGPGRAGRPRRREDPDSVKSRAEARPTASRRGLSVRRARRRARATVPFPAPSADCRSPR